MACAKAPYIAKPLDRAETTAKLLHKRPASAGFNAYLISQGYLAHELPVKSWGINELTYCALFYHTKLDLAKAQLALANAQIDSAQIRQNPIINSDVARSNQKNGDINPWALGLNIEIPVVTNNKRQIRVEEAQHLAEAARLNAAEVTWQLRAQIAKDLLRYHENTALIALLKNTLATYTKIVDLLQKRLSLGAISNTDFSIARLELQKTQSALYAEEAKLAENRAILAADVGLSIEKFSEIQLKPVDIDQIITQHTQILNTPDQAKNLQTDALLNRIDIRRSLANYAAAEAKIKLEVAKQTPDIVLRPGYAFEFGDSVWSLGFSALLSLLNKNATLIAEATSLREIEGAQFEALQANVIADLSQALALYQANTSNMNSADIELKLAQQTAQKQQKQFDSGLIDRLEMTQNQLNIQNLEKQLLSEKFNLLSASLAIENVMQKPIFEVNRANE